MWKKPYKVIKEIIEIIYLVLTSLAAWTVIAEYYKH